jgi:glutamate-5-semialdehyde dehydrogenase
MKIEQLIKDVAVRARTASRAIYSVPGKKRDTALRTAAKLLVAEKRAIIAANAKDISVAKKSGLASALVERLVLDDKRINVIASALISVASQPDPVGFVDEESKRPNGMRLQKVRVPIGSILIIYESRPNVTIDSAGLCLKSGNSVILRGGKEAFHSNTILASIFRKALKKTGITEDCVQLLGTTDREAILHLVHETDNIDLVIPRGGEALIKYVSENSRIPVLKHYKGVCHVFVDKDADLSMAIRIAVNAKVNRPSVCNSMETLLIDEKLPAKSAVVLMQSLIDAGVKLKGCSKSRKLLPSIGKAHEADYYTEHLSLNANVRVVAGVKEAAAHISRFGSAHTDSIVTRNRKCAEEFISLVDSSSVMWNVSTRLADGGEYGLGAEIGISTDKLHSRGPMGARDLTTYKWVVSGNGQLRK